MHLKPLDGKRLESLALWADVKFGFERYIKDSTRCSVKNDFHTLKTSHLYSFNRGNVIINDFQGFANFFSTTYPHLRLTHFDIGISRNFWNFSTNTKFYLELISQKIPTAIQRQIDWFQMEDRLLIEMNGSVLLKRYSVLEILENNFPGFFWERKGRFPTSAPVEERRVFLDDFILKHFGGVQTNRELSKIDSLHFLSIPRSGVIVLPYRGSLQALFIDLYPALVNPRWGFKRSTGFWRNFKKNFELQRAMRVFDIGTKEGWYKLSVEQFAVASGRKVSKMNVIKLLEFWNPEEEWIYGRFSESSNKRSRQRYLGLRLRELFSNEVIFEDYVFRDVDKFFVFDFYLPGLSLVIEYQGEQHYSCGVLRWLSLNEQQQRDKEKKRVCVQNELRLVEVPYWWDNSVDSLKKILCNKEG